MTIKARKQDNKYYNASPTCKFCNTVGHTIANCPTMKSLYQTLKDLPIEDRGFRGNYAVQYIERKKKKSSSPSTKKCGYCRELGHTRKTCEKLQNDKELIIKANRLWRKVWASKATSLGLTPVSLIKITSDKWSSKGFEETVQLCTVGAELPENLNIFALGKEERNQEINIPLIGYTSLYGTNKVSLKDLVCVCDAELQNRLFSYLTSSTRIKKIEVVATSNYRFSDEWLNSSPMEDIEYALKKWNKEQMRSFLSRCDNLINAYGGTYGIK